MTASEDKGRSLRLVKDLEPAKKGEKRVVVLPVYSTKVMAGLETDETLSRVKRVQRKKGRNRLKSGPKNQRVGGKKNE